MKVAAKKMAERRRLFVEYYLDHENKHGGRGNGYAAAVLAGYPTSSARSTASQLLKRPEIRQQIEAVHKAAMDKIRISKEELIRELKIMALARPSNFIGRDGKFIDFHDLPEWEAAIQDVHIFRIKDKKKKPGPPQYFYSFHSKLESIEKLAKHIGFYKADNEHKVDLTDALVEIWKKRKAKLQNKKQD